MIVSAAAHLISCAAFASNILGKVHMHSLYHFDTTVAAVSL